MRVSRVLLKKHIFNTEPGNSLTWCWSLRKMIFLKTISQVLQSYPDTNIPNIALVFGSNLEHNRIKIARYSTSCNAIQTPFLCPSFRFHYDSKQDFKTDCLLWTQLSFPTRL